MQLNPAGKSECNKHAMALRRETSVQEGDEVESHEVVRDFGALPSLKIALGVYAA